MNYYTLYTIYLKGKRKMIKTLEEAFASAEPKKKLSQRDIVMLWIKYNSPDEVPSWKLISTKTPYGWLGTSADRLARDCVSKGMLKRQHHTIKGVRHAFYSLPNPEEEQLNLF